MESLQSALRMITKDCYIASIDLKDAYYCVLISKKDQKYVKFLWESKLYMFNDCPIGLCMSPRLFTNLKYLRLFFFLILRHSGHQSVVYIDDTYLQGETVEICNQNVMATIKCYLSLDLL